MSAIPAEESDQLLIRPLNISADDMLYTETDLEESMDKIETINFHEVKEVAGIKFWCYHAGHVLGAAMFMIEIAGVKLLYTGDFSRQEDRHLMAAEIPNIKPDILIIVSISACIVICVSTHGIPQLPKRKGLVLIAVLNVANEYWQNHPELHDIPIYYASSLAKKCMAVYQTYVNAMNDKIRKQININNPFVFKHISNLKSMDHFDDIGPSVVMASPGMMQSGLSRELFESWCTDKRNGVIIAGYCVEGTLAKHIMSEPEEITTMSGQKLPLKMSVDYISFSAHTDYQQTSEFIRALKPPHVILVHGEQNEMARLKAALIREYEDNDEVHIEVHNPRNTEAVTLNFRGEKLAKWLANPSNDMYADTVTTVILEVQSNPKIRKGAVQKVSKKLEMHVYSKRLEIMLQDIFGEDCVSVKDGSILSVTVDGKTANINLETRTVECEEGSEDDESLREMVELAAQRLYEALTPVH
ncbi:Cleavage and Polyadenylation Specifity Factor protein-like protein [Camelus ferus]|nr:Cleavage and Polyadenylation Specifity Factor protein-like protein [Camelus ferus]